MRKKLIEARINPHGHMAMAACDISKLVFSLTIFCEVLNSVENMVHSFQAKGNVLCAVTSSCLV